MLAVNEQEKLVDTAPRRQQHPPSPSLAGLEHLGADVSPLHLPLTCLGALFYCRPGYRSTEYGVRSNVSGADTNAVNPCSSRGQSRLPTASASSCRAHKLGCMAPAQHASSGTHRTVHLAPNLHIYPLIHFPYPLLLSVRVLARESSLGAVVGTRRNETMDGSREVARTPARGVGGARNSTASSTGKQQSILGFFSKGSSAGSNAAVSSSSPSVKLPPAGKENRPSPNQNLRTKATSLPRINRQSSSITPAPSSDPAGPPSSRDSTTDTAPGKVATQSLPSPMTPAEAVVKPRTAVPMLANSSPSRKVLRQPNHFLIVPVC